MSVQSRRAASDLGAPHRRASSSASLAALLGGGVALLLLGAAPALASEPTTAAMPSMTVFSTSTALQAGPTTPSGVAIIQAHAQTLRPAPMPDQDLDAPGPDASTLAAQDQASLHPSFYAPTSHFSGDGFAAGSTIEDDHNSRQKPAGGMSLSIPMQ